MPKYLVYVQESYADAAAMIVHPDGEFGGEHYAELDQKAFIVGDYESETPEEAIRYYAKHYEADPAVFGTYVLEEQPIMICSLDDVIEAELEVVMELDDGDDIPSYLKEAVAKNPKKVAELIGSGWESFTDMVRERLMYLTEEDLEDDEDEAITG